MESEKIDGRIFLDFDETLVSSFWCERPNMVQEYIDEIEGKYEHVVFSRPDWGKSSCITFIRPMAEELIKFCRELVGVENTSILTLGSHDYATTALGVISQQHPEFKFPPHRIYTREDLHVECPIYNGTNNILVDNENYMFHFNGGVNKVKFLYNLSPKKFIQIAFFDARIHLGDDDEYLDMMKYRIIETLKTKL